MRTSASGASPDASASARALVWIPLALLVLWVALQNPDYSDRANLYGVVSSVLDTYRQPVWAAFVAAAAVALFIAGRRRRTEVVQIADRPADLHVREEAAGRLAVIVSSGAAALDRDYAFDRRPESEGELLSRLTELAARSAAFPERSPASPEGNGTSDLHRGIYSVGLSLADLLLGPDESLRDLIFDLPGEHLLLRLQPSLAHLPWEMIVPRPGATYLWQRFHVGRQVRHDSQAPEPGSWGRGPLRMLVLANLESGTAGRSLPEAEGEAAELMELAAIEPDRLRVVRRNPRSPDELRVALGEGFDVVHFAGHTVDSGDRNRWVLADGASVDPAEVISASGSPPMLVFANACASGREVRLSGRAGDAPVRILASGVAAYVGTLWEIADRDAAHFSRVFYRGLLSGATLGQSLTAARSSHMGVSPFGWANYVLYGDPTAVLAGSRRR